MSDTLLNSVTTYQKLLGDLPKWEVISQWRSNLPKLDVISQLTSEVLAPENPTKRRENKCTLSHIKTRREQLNGVKLWFWMLFGKIS
jgi:hypothetical protein